MDVEGHELDASHPVPAVLILAALERAQRHGGTDVWVVAVGEHLGFECGRATTRRLRPRLLNLRIAGSVSKSERHGREYWTLTPAGRRRLAAARQAGEVDELPESPQHRVWRRARAAAGEQIGGFAELASDVIGDAERALAAGDVTSEQLFELSERLRWNLWRLGSATYCLREWDEPDDARPDRDETPGPGPGRRSTSAWKEQFDG
jgi:hypothetical protein